MNARTRAVLIGLAVVVAVVAGTFPLWRPLVVNDVVEEAFPGMSDAARGAFAALPQDQQAAFIAMSDVDVAMAQTMVEAAVSPDVGADEAMPEMPATPTIQSRGAFVALDAVHRGEGTATIYTLEGGARVLRLDDFRVTNGPDLHVVLARADAPRNHADLGEDYIDLGMLKGNVGSQNYDIPADVDVSGYASVVIYCVPFQVVFTTATLGTG